MSGSFLPQTATTPTVTVKLTEKGRELLTKGFFDQDTFDIVKFSLGDSEINYDMEDSEIAESEITRPSDYAVDFKSKLYAVGSPPSGRAFISLSLTDIELSINQSISVSAESYWPPVSGPYVENYKWENLGPLTNYEFSIVPSNNTRAATITAFDVAGEAIIRVVGQTTGKYALIRLVIE